MTERGKRYVTQDGLDRMLSVVGRWCGEKISESLRASVEPLKRRIEELENVSLKDAGVWQPGKSYRVGDCVTHNSVFWACRIAGGDGKPGRSGAWRLLFKGPMPRARCCDFFCTDRRVQVFESPGW